MPLVHLAAPSHAWRAAGCEMLDSPLLAGISVQLAPSPSQVPKEKI